MIILNPNFQYQLQELSCLLVRKGLIQTISEKVRSRMVNKIPSLKATRDRKINVYGYSIW